MLALLGLVGLAVAGTAFVGAMPSAADDGPSEGPLSEEREETSEGAPDLLAQLDEADAPEAALTQSATLGEVIVGGAEDDDLSGTDGDDYMAGYEGDDLMTGADGDDQMHGNQGDDTMDADTGEDQAFGYFGDDIMRGGEGDDTLHGGSGADVIDGGDGDDQILGGYDNDTLFGGAGQDQLQGSDGDDTLDGTAGEVVAERDYLNGSEGNDRLIGNAGDVMTGGDGADEFAVVAGSDGVVSIMDYTSDDTLELYFEGNSPTLSTQLSDSGIILLADGIPVAEMLGVQDFDVSAVQLVAN